MDGDISELAARAVTWLQVAGARQGDRVAVIAENAPGTLALTWGALRAGIVPVPLNTQLADPQLRDLVADCRPRLVVADGANADRVEAAPPVLRLDTDVLAEQIPAAGLAALPRARAMHYTSGTTGSSKGVWSGVFDDEQASAWAADERAANPTGGDDVHLVCSYLFHSGPHRYALNTLNWGGRVVILPRFDAGAALAAIQRERVTTAFMVPTHLARILDHPDLGSTDLSSLRWVHHAGAACPEPLKRRAIAALGDGVLHEFLGATEGQFTAISPLQWQARPSSVGRARAGRRLRITSDTKEPLPIGEVGQIWVTAPGFARFTYFEQPEATAAAWDGDWFTVGDLGRLDEDGYLYLGGRREDLIITGGVNVYPAEVEAVLLAHPEVLEGVVFGVEDERWGQQVTAAVVPRRGAAPDADEVRAFLRARLAGFQTPKVVQIVDELPRTASGKVIRSRLTRDLG